MTKTVSCHDMSYSLHYTAIVCRDPHMADKQSKKRVF
jgi:hypothetical protein